LAQAQPAWGAAHVGLAAITWSLLIALCAIEVHNSREQSQQVGEQQPAVTTA
jgi:hypothetical protein